MQINISVTNPYKTRKYAQEALWLFPNKYHNLVFAHVFLAIHLVFVNIDNVNLSWFLAARLPKQSVAHLVCHVYGCM